ncbi:unnamed protein product [Ectocarpus sp. 4 AP-2014]
MADEAPTAGPSLASDNPPATREMTTTAEEGRQRASGSVSGNDGELNDGSTTNTANDVTPNTATTGADLAADDGAVVAAAAAAAAATNGGQVGNGRPPRTQSIRQGRKEKRKAGWAAKKTRIKEKKREERERREEAMRKEGQEIPMAGTNYKDLPQEQWSVSQRIRNAKRMEFETSSKEGGYRVCIDMAFDDLMLEKAQASLVQQVLYAYGTNRKAAQPCRVTLSGMGPVMTAKVNKLQGFDTWLGMTTDSRCYTEIFDKEELIYLSADSPATITHLEKGKVYIVGGLVDRNAHKGLCYEKAKKQEIVTGRLPLKKEDLYGAHSKVLATNHVFDILVRAMGNGGDLEKVEKKALPPRKRANWTGGDDRGPSSMPIRKQKSEKSDETSAESDRNSPELGVAGKEGERAAGVDTGGESKEGSTTAADNNEKSGEGGEKVDAEVEEEKGETGVKRVLDDGCREETSSSGLDAKRRNSQSAGPE